MAVVLDTALDYKPLILANVRLRQFGQSHFRVLVIANSERRLRSIRKVVRSSTQKIFKFATFESIGAKSFFGPVWHRPEGDEGQALFATVQNSS